MPPTKPVLLRSETVFRGKKFIVTENEFKLPSGERTNRAIIRHGGAIVIAPQLADGRFLLVRQFRYPLEDELLEFPAGTIELNEEPMLCATRELEEETNYRAKNLIALTSFYSAPGFCNEILYAFLATGLEPCQGTPDGDEVISEVVPMTIEELRDFAQKGKLQDAKTLATLYLLDSRGFFNK